jgi:hypothetical protein
LDNHLINKHNYKRATEELRDKLKAAQTATKQSSSGEDKLNNLLQNFKLHLTGYEGGKKTEEVARSQVSKVRCVLETLCDEDRDHVYSESILQKLMTIGRNGGALEVLKKTEGLTSSTLQTYAQSIKKLLDFLDIRPEFRLRWQDHHFER